MGNLRHTLALGLKLVRILAVRVGGGNQNKADGVYAAVGGGLMNNASGDYAFIGGGYRNRASSFAATVAGSFPTSLSVPSEKERSAGDPCKPLGRYAVLASLLASRRPQSRPSL